MKPRRRRLDLEDEIRPATLSGSPCTRQSNTSADSVNKRLQLPKREVVHTPVALIAELQIAIKLATAYTAGPKKTETVLTVLVE